MNFQDISEMNKSCIRGVVGGIVKVNVEKLLYSEEKKLRNSEVSKQGSHNSIATFPHIVLRNIEFFSHN